MFLIFSLEIFQENIDTKNLFCSTYFRSDFRQIFGDFDVQIFEVVENLFMKHLTKNLTNIDNLGVRLKEIKA